MIPLFVRGLLCVIFLILNTAFSAQEQEDKRIEADICIYGATSAGIIAAYTASKLGKTVILVDPGVHLGGLSSGGLGQTDIGNKYAVTGLALDFYRRIGKHYGKFEQWVFEPHVAANIFQEYIKNSKIKLLTGNRIIDANKKDLVISDITVQRSTSPAGSSKMVIAAKMFIDCTYEGDLMALAGVPFIVGREANSAFNETYNGVQMANSLAHQFPDGIDPYKIPGKPESGLLWGISDEKLQEDGAADKKVQAYNFRICLTDNKNNQVKITRPERYDSSRYELLLRVMNKQPWKSLTDGFIWSPMPNQKTDINNRGSFSTDMIGVNYDYPEASYERRREIIAEHVNYTKGLLYFIGHDSRVSLTIRKEMLKWGYPKDEYIDNGNWTPQLYIREARRMVGAYTMTQANCEGKERVTDGVGTAAYTMDSHNCQRIVANGMVKNEGNVEIGGFDPYPISYRSLTPNAEHCKNLLVPVCLSATHIAYGSIRMEPVFMVLGQSSAVAASMAIDHKQPVQEVDVEKVQGLLKADPYLDGRAPEILIDNEDKKRIAVTGEWQLAKAGGYGPDFLVDTSESQTAKSIRYTPEIINEGKYDIYAYYPKLKNGASRTHVTVFDGKSKTEKIIDRNEIKIIGQTSGAWVSLGTYNLLKGNKSAVEISNKNADGAIFADAILLVPVRQP